LIRHSIIKCIRLHSQPLVLLICLTVAMMFAVLSVQAQTDAMLPAIGGGGGSEFVARCPEGKLLTGFGLQAGDWVDAIRPICVADYAVYSVSPDEPYPSKFGGDGGHPRQLLCENASTKDGHGELITIPLAPIVLGMYVGSEGKHTVTVNRIHLICGVADPDDIEKIDDARIREGLVANKGEPPRVRYDGITHYAGPEGEQSCPQGLVAVGIHGRSGVFLDAVGLICGAPKLTPAPNGNWGSWSSPPPPVTLGRVQPTSPPGPPMSICARARDARARKSPTASALEAQCRAAGAAGEKTPGSVALGRVQPTSPPGPPMSICARARAARARNSPTAPALEAQCRAAGAAGEAAPTAGPTITAAPNPVIVPNGQTSSTTTISWKAAPDYTYSEIYLSVDNGEWSEFARGSDSAKPIAVKLGSSYTFRMMVYEGQAGTPKILTTLTLTPAKN
jgi:hypothetical protein